MFASSIKSISTVQESIFYNQLNIMYLVFLNVVSFPFIDKELYISKYQCIFDRPIEEPKNNLNSHLDCDIQ